MGTPGWGNPGLGNQALGNSALRNLSIGNSIRETPGIKPEEVRKDSLERVGTYTYTARDVLIRFSTGPTRAMSEQVRSTECKHES